jgi:glycyl-tRNA synthetase beta chain
MPSIRGRAGAAAAAFAKQLRRAGDALERIVTEKGAWLVFRGIERGIGDRDLLGRDRQPGHCRAAHREAHALGRAQRRVRAAGAYGVVLLHGDEVVPLEVLGLSAGRTTLRPSLSCAPAHRPQVGAKGYEKRLRSAKVIGDFAKRREAITRRRDGGRGHRRHGLDRGCLARRSHRPGRMAGADRRPVRAALSHSCRAKW